MPEESPQRLGVWAHRARLGKWLGVTIAAAVISSAVGFAVAGDAPDWIPGAGSHDDQPALDAATQVRACIRAHDLSKANDAEWRTSPREIGELSNKTRVFQSCTWPPMPGADPDGYTEIQVRFAEGPNTKSEWPIGPIAYRITSDECQTFAVALGRSGGTGHIDHLEPVRIQPNQIKTAENEIWINDPEVSKLPFFPVRDEAVLLSNSHYSLDGIECEA